MEEAMVDSTLDLNLPSADGALPAGGVQGDQVKFPASVYQSYQALCQWSQSRAQRVESLQQCVTSGVYCVDSTELAQCIWNNSTHFFEIDFAVAETC